MCHTNAACVLTCTSLVWFAACAVTTQAECAITYVPYFQECLKRDNGIGVASAQKYERLYESCANIDEMEVGILITDHNVRETLSICDQAYIVNDGMIIAEGDPSEVLTNQHVKEVYLGADFRM